MTEIPEGSRIKATKGETVIVGELVEIENRTDYYINIDDEADAIWIDARQGWTIEMLEVTLPTHANAVVYSEEAWAVARRASDGADKWFADPSAWRKSTSLTSAEMLEWTKDWVVLR